MSDTRISEAALKRWSMPVRSIDAGRTAVYQGDAITILTRVGSHYFCRVGWGFEEGERFHCWIHKRRLRRLSVRREVCKDLLPNREQRLCFECFFDCAGLTETKESLEALMRQL